MSETPNEITSNTVTNTTTASNTTTTTNNNNITTNTVITTSNNESITSKRQIKVTHQILVISNIDFESETLYGYTELTLASNQIDSSQFESFSLNLKQAKIYCVCFNASLEVADYEYNDPALIKPCNDETKRDLQSLLYQDELGRLSVDADELNGEILIQLPEQIREQLRQNLTVKLAVEFSVEKPQAGLRFVKDLGCEQDTPVTLLYSCDNNSHFWFPCVASYAEFSTWKIEITCDSSLQVITTGQLIETEQVELTELKHHFFVSQPTCAPNIGLCIGKFDSFQDETIGELVFYAEPPLMDLMKQTVSFLHDTFEFYEEFLNKHYPHPAPFKLVFVYDTVEECLNFTNLALINVNLLHSQQIIDQAFVTRRVLAHALARQYFGCYLTQLNWHNWWLLSGLASFITNLYLKKLLGNNEYKYMIYQDMKEVCQYEREHGYILLDLNFNELNLKDQTSNKCNILLKNPLIAQLNFMRVAEKKAHLVLRLLDDTLTRDIFLQLISKLLNEAQLNTSKLALSLEYLCDRLAEFSSKDLRHLIDHWVVRSGCARFNASFSFNRKKNMLELELKQDMSNQRGYKKYTGPITFIIQELDGSFVHQMQIDDQASSSKFDIALHSKGKKSKKKKIPLITGEEVDIDTTHMDSDSPILWIRIDPDMKILREIKFDQPDHQWQHQLRYERDICAQLDALDYLGKFPTAQTRSTLLSCVENNECYFRVRIQASHVLADVANRMAHSWNGPLPFVSTFRTFFKSPSAPNLVRSNNFSDLQMYYLQKSLPVAMANLRTVHNVCPTEVVRFLLDLIKYNENSKNKFSDTYYRASLIDALANTLSSSVAAFNNKSSNLSSELYSVIEEIILRLNLEKILPSYQYTISMSCLRALRRLQKLGHIPDDKSIFKQYALNKTTFDLLRVCAFDILCEFLTLRHDDDLFQMLLQTLEQDHSELVKLKLVEQLQKYAANFKFNFEEASKQSELYMNKLWQLICKHNLNYRIKSALVDFYHLVYGFNKPKCLRQLKETLKLSETIEAVNLF